jgi:hypothetical protein
MTGNLRIGIVTPPTGVYRLARGNTLETAGTPGRTLPERVANRIDHGETR